MFDPYSRLHLVGNKFGCGCYSLWITEASELQSLLFLLNLMQFSAYSFDRIVWTVDCSGELFVNPIFSFYTPFLRKNKSSALEKPILQVSLNMLGLLLDKGT